MKQYQKIIGALSLTYSCAALSACAQATLKDGYANEFLIGTIMPGGLDPDATFTDDPTELGVVARDFNALTAAVSENNRGVESYILMCRAFGLCSSDP